MFKWLGLKRLDFYIPSKKIAIECQGIQHFKPIDFGGKGEEYAKKYYEYTKHNDLTKKQLCEQNNITVLYYTNIDIECDYEIITDANKLLENILNS